MTISHPCPEEFDAFGTQNADLGEVERYRLFSRRLFAQEKFADAAWYAAQAIALLQRTGEEVPDDDYHHAEACAYAAGIIDQSLACAEKLAARTPGDRRAWLRIGLYHMLRADNEAAERYYLKARDLCPEDANTCDALAHLYGLIGQSEKMERYGNKALQLKEAEAMAPENLNKVYRLVGNNYRIQSKVPRFDPEAPERNVIAFSLWGDNANYLDGAVLNASIANVIYPGWSCRFYCDVTVPGQVVTKLTALGADVRVLEKNTLPFFGLFWRFFVADDPNVDRYLIRDCDCILNCQERVAVDEWLQSGKHFHVMRDYASHTELIHAGMWGGVRGAIPSITDLIVDYYDHNGKERTIDQRFLRHYLWPIVRQSNLTHDSHYRFGGSRKFPALGRYPKGFANVGMNWQAVYGKRKALPLLNF